MKETTTIRITKDFRKDLMLFKIQSDAKNIEEVLKLAIKKLKQEVGDEKEV